MEVYAGSRYIQTFMHLLILPSHLLGYVHSAYCFGQESFCATNPSIVHSDVPSGYLVTLILKGLQFASIEQHVGEDGRERECNKPYLLLEPHVCSVVEDTNNASNTTTDNSKKKQVKRKRKGMLGVIYLCCHLERTLKTPASEEDNQR